MHAKDLAWRLVPGWPVMIAGSLSDLSSLPSRAGRSQLHQRLPEADFSAHSPVHSGEMELASQSPGTRAPSLFRLGNPPLVQGHRPSEQIVLEVSPNRGWICSGNPES